MRTTWQSLKSKILIIAIATLVLGCGINAHWHALRTSIKMYENVSEQIELGDTKESFLSLILPTQEPLKEYSFFRKPPEKYIKDDVLVEIYFVMSNHQHDGIKTDDEFTPYVFNNGKLVGIGWSILGGPSTQAQATPVTNVTTNVTVESPPPPILPLR